MTTPDELPTPEPSSQPEQLRLGDGGPGALPPNDRRSCPGTGLGHLHGAARRIRRVPRPVDVSKGDDVHGAPSPTMLG